VEKDVGQKKEAGLKKTEIGETRRKREQTPPE